MPVIRIETNVTVDPSARAAFLADLSRLAATMLHKPEGYMVVGLNDGLAMLFGGEDSPMAYVEAKSIGLTAAGAADVSKTLTAFLGERLGIDAARIYIEMASPDGKLWGWKGGTF
jgi:phenylpyruvate tautomerase PptA (4-oxalocrotonate tautomerase family)